MILMEISPENYCLYNISEENMRRSVRSPLEHKNSVGISRSGSDTPPKEPPSVGSTPAIDEHRGYQERSPEGGIAGFVVA